MPFATHRSILARWAITPTLLLMLAGALSTSAGCSPVASVDELVAVYDAHRPAFVELASSVPTDSDFGVEVDGYGGVTASGIDGATAAVYSEQLHAIGAQGLEVAFGDLSVYMGRDGIVPSGAEWGWTYSPDVPPDGVISLEDARDPDNAWELWYYPVGDGWYAYVYLW